MTPHFADDHLTIWAGDVREVLPTLPAESVHCVVTSPPYWGLRDYGTPGQLGLEPTPEEYVADLVAIFREVRRVLRADGTVWLNLGDSYFGTGKGPTPPTGMHGANGTPYPTQGVYRHSMLKEKDLVGIPWRVAFALQADGWYLRSDIIWSKPNPMPESVTDRPTKAHEYLFLLTKSARYWYDADAVREAAESGPSDLRKMAESRERIGGLVKEQTDPLLAASGLTNIGRKRAVGGAPLERERNIGGRDDGFTRMPGGEAEWAENGRAGRNLRSVWTIATQPYPGAHFATFPERLVEPCVKAGTSERGVCPECGAPWSRVVERERPDLTAFEHRRSSKSDPGMMRHDADSAAGRLSGQEWNRLSSNVTTGWRPSCAHDAEPVPATVLDPFAGSGTTARVANRLGRRAVLIELNPDYIDQALTRNAQAPLGLGA